MPDYDSDSIAALQADSGSGNRRWMLWIRGSDNSGTAKTFGFWTGADDVTVTVVKATDPGSTESRAYIGSGSLLSDGVDPITYQLGIVAQTINVKLSQIHSSVQDMVRGANIRLAEAELHRALFDVATGEIVSTPFPRFYGIIEGAPVNTPAVGGDGSITLAITSVSIDLTRTNPALKSDEATKLRSGDRFRQYSGVTGQYTVDWGEARS